MRAAKDLLHDIRHTKRHGCMSEYKAWIDDVVEYLENEVADKAAMKDPTIQNQLHLDIPEPTPGEIRYSFQLLGD